MSCTRARSFNGCQVNININSIQVKFVKNGKNIFTECHFDFYYTQCTYNIESKL